MFSISNFVGLTFQSVKKSDDNEYIDFLTVDGVNYHMYHSQDCCESVYVESIVGDLQDLVGSEILSAEEVTHSGENPEGVDIPDYQDSFTWTFYKLSTRKGYVDIRWYGGSNGYYSESVDIVEGYAE